MALTAPAYGEETVMSLACPKCGGFSWIETDETDVYWHCTCGYYKLVYTKLNGGGAVTHTEPRDRVRLPVAGTKLSKCLGMLKAYSPSTTGELAQRLGQSSSDTASQLSVLLAKGLAHRIAHRKGVAGGSTWEVTELTLELMEA